MKHDVRILICTAAVLGLYTAGCGGKESVASKSAAAYREAQAKGLPVAAGGGHSHGSPDADSGTSVPATDHSTMTGMDHSPAPGADHSTMAGMDHSNMAGRPANAGAHSQMDHSQMAGMDHSNMAGVKRTPHSGAHSQMDHSMPGSTSHPTSHSAATGSGHSAMAGMDHSSMPTKAQPGAAHSQMDHSSMTASPQAMAGMDHGQPGAHTAPGVDHSAMPGMQHGAALPEAQLDIDAPRSSSDIASLRPRATLEPDAFDAPRPVAVAEALKASSGGTHSGHGGAHAPSPRQTGTPATTPPGSGHEGHAHGSSTTTIAPQTPTATLYSCPIHPEVTSANPGTCEKCGRTLVKKETK